VTDDIETLALTNTAKASPSFTLVVTDGPDRGARLEIDAASPTRLLIGQSAACALKLRDPHVSRRHVAIETTPSGLHVTDLRSTNGTFVGDVAIVEAYLAGGESLRVGETTIGVERSAAPRVTVALADHFGRVIGASNAMQRLYPLCARLAASSVPVVIEGETGTGKEMLAEALHEEGPRAKEPFVVFDCTTVAPNLLESALFGHEKGAFTGAVATHKGVFEQADGGTLFIDEIGDLDLPLQSKLLRAIERSEVQRVGGAGLSRVDVRVLAATRRDLDREVQAGRFRDDLFFRLAVTRIELPPLRERRGDVSQLAAHFWRQLGGTGQLPTELVQRLEDYDWPGNVRELHNAIARRIALGDLAPPTKTSTPPPRTDADASIDVPLDLPFSAARQNVIDAFERVYVTRVLAQHGGNVMRAAAASGIARRYFHVLKARAK
jgi:DNA-binding NtrC family response regulator